jgi:Flp pilus assembly protein TadD
MYYKDYQKEYYSKNESSSEEYFQNKFECRIEDSKEYRQHVRQLPYYKWDGREPYSIETQVVPMKAVHLTSDNLARLVAEQELIQHLKYDAEQGKKLWRQEREDNAVRALNPAVEKAYRNYQLLLELARK